MIHNSRHSVLSNSLRPHGLYSPGILQARILELVAVPFCRDLLNPGMRLRSPALQVNSLTAVLPGKHKTKVKVKSLSRVRLCATPQTVACQAPPSMEFSRQEYWSELPFPSLGDLPNPGIEPGSCTLQADALPSEPPGKPKATSKVY